MSSDEGIKEAFKQVRGNPELSHFVQWAMIEHDILRKIIPWLKKLGLLEEAKDLMVDNREPLLALQAINIILEKQ